jgi:hypothetical protein
VRRRRRRKKKKERERFFSSSKNSQPLFPGKKKSCHSCLDVAAIASSSEGPLDFDRELKTVGVANVAAGAIGAGFTGSYIFSQVRSVVGGVFFFLFSLFFFFFSL